TGLPASDDTNWDPRLADLEARVLDAANKLNIGPMGFGGRLTVGGCKIGMRNRLPASFFVSVAYMCWAYRRRGVVLDPAGEVIDWLYQARGEFDHADEKANREADRVDLGLPSDPNAVVRLQTPLTEAGVRKLRAGDIVLLSGTVFTGRDAVHKYLYQGGELDV